VIVRDFDIVGVAVDKAETDAPLIVDGYCMLPFAVTFELMESITWRNPKVVWVRRQVDVLELSPRPSHDIGWQPLGPTSREQLLCVPVREGLDHDQV
jgi:hypothetical protein